MPWCAIRARTPSGLPLPAGASARGATEAVSAACAWHATCLVTGTYQDTHGHEQILLDTLSGHTWTPTKAHLPAGATMPGAVNGPQTAACGSAGNCVAALAYKDSAGHHQALFETLAGGKWTARTAPVPANAAADPGTHILSLACGSATTCAAVGNYLDKRNNTDSFIETWSGAAWKPLPAPAPGTGSAAFGLLSVACGSAMTCLAVGDYVDIDANENPLLETLSGGTWTPAEGLLPATRVFTMMGAAACTSATACVAGGTYTDSVQADHVLLETLFGTAWTPSIAPLPGSTGGIASVNSMACASAFTCVAAGTDEPGSNQLGFLLTGPG